MRIIKRLIEWILTPEAVNVPELQKRIVLYSELI